MQKIVKVQKGKLLYMNFPTDIVKKMEIEKGENVLIEVIDKDTMQIKFID